MAYVIAAVSLVPAFFVHKLLYALPVIVISGFFLAGAGPLLDAVRMDVLVPKLRGRAEAIRGVIRTLAEGAAPLVFGVMAGVLAGGGHAGLRLTFLLLLPALFLNGALVLVATKTYPGDMAAALASRPNR